MYPSIHLCMFPPVHLFIHPSFHPCTRPPFEIFEILSVNGHHILLLANQTRVVLSYLCCFVYGCVYTTHNVLFADVNMYIQHTYFVALFIPMYSSYGPSIKYVTLFLMIFDPLSPCHKLSQIFPPPLKVCHTSEQKVNIKQISRMIRSYYILNNNKRPYWVLVINHEIPLQI